MNEPFINPHMIAAEKEAARQRGTSEKPYERAKRIAENPDAASDSDKLRSVADLLELTGAKMGYTGREMEDFLRDLADRIES